MDSRLDQCEDRLSETEDQVDIADHEQSLLDMSTLNYVKQNLPDLKG